MIALRYKHVGPTYRSKVLHARGGIKGKEAPLYAPRRVVVDVKLIAPMSVLLSVAKQNRHWSPAADRCPSVPAMLWTSESWIAAGILEITRTAA